MDQDIPFERIGGYRVVRRLATGGTSDVLLARAEGPHGFERTVVLKLLLQQFQRDAPMEKMFAREAAAYARLSHPAIVKLYDFFSAEGQLVMVLEYIDGLPLNRLRAMLRKTGDQLDDRASIFVASRVFAALAAAHGARDPETGEFAPVIHRDVNPSNVLIPWDGHVKLGDFGIAKVAGVTSDTQSGYIKGTYGYMAPEQVRGEPVTVRSDVYAASLLLWELLARRKAIQRGALPEMEVLRAMAEPSLPALDVLRPDLPQRLREAVARGLEPQPDQRSVTAEDMLVVLRESVTSNEGRNVLAETLARVRPSAGDSGRTTSQPPPPVSSSEPAGGAPPRVPPPSRVPSQPAVEDFKRTSLGMGQPLAPAYPPTLPPEARMGRIETVGFEVPIDAAAVRAAGLARPRVESKTLFGMAQAPLAPLVPLATSGVDQTAFRVDAPPAEHAPPPPLPLRAPIEVAGPSMPPVLGAPTPSMAPALGPGAVHSLGPPGYERVDSFFPQGSMPASPMLTPPPPGTPAPMHVPLSGPPPAMVTVENEPMRAGRLALPAHEDTAVEAIPIGAGRGGTYALIAGVALVASAAVVAVLLFAQRSAPPSRTAVQTDDTTSRPTATATATVAPTAKAAVTAPATATVAPAATATATVAPAATATATATATVAPTATPAPAADAPASPAIPAGSGRILTPASIGNHRVFVDGRYAGDTPSPVVVKCGTHSVQIGSHGTARTVDVPCGSDVTLIGH